MAIKANLIRLLMAQQAATAALIAQLQGEAKAPEPECDPPFIPEKIPKPETQHEAWLRQNRDLIREGKAISANLMRPTPRPPRRPNQQSERHNGLWTYWRY